MFLKSEKWSDEKMKKKNTDTTVDDFVVYLEIEQQVFSNQVDSS